MVLSAKESQVSKVSLCKGSIDKSIKLSLKAILLIAALFGALFQHQPSPTATIAKKDKETVRKDGLVNDLRKSNGSLFHKEP